MDSAFARCASSTVQAPLAELATHLHRLVLAFVTFCFSALCGSVVIRVIVVRASHLPLHLNFATVLPFGDDPAHMVEPKRAPPMASSLVDGRVERNIGRNVIKQLLRLALFLIFKCTCNTS